ncbi:hypothetical protein PIB30_059428 [Stylosanthes scabra]|uniref:DUF223 domain-containing protein n=1 Tax=Stylosanthes scabra TaxID=79078 RepID=A0ABU6SLB0_9FABA|nr:hypothetical protein [Stylosanthes scabra]
MRNFIVKLVGKGLRVTSHKFKLRFFVRTCVSRVSLDDFQFSPFRFTPFPEINGMCSNNDIFLIDVVGQVVGKEDPEDIITKAGQSSKRMRLYLKDEESMKNKMKCTLFGDFVADALISLQKENVEPLVMVAQMFKPHVYLSDFCIQPSFYGSRVFFNSDFPEVEQLRNQLIILGDQSTQQISHVESQSQRSVTEEIISGTFPLRSIEKVVGMTEGEQAVGIMHFAKNATRKCFM